MEPKLQVRVQRYGWDAAAPYYDRGWQAQLRPAHDCLLAELHPQDGERILETACGSGLVTLRIAQSVGPSGSVLATDLSDGMIAALNARLEDDGVPNVRTARMAAEHLDVAEAVFDAAVCALGLMYTPDPSKAVAEMARAVKAEGRVAATVWGERRRCGWAEVFPIVDRRVASEVCPLFFGTGAPGALARLFGQAGLRDVREIRQSEFLKFASDDEVATSVLLGGPVALAVKRFTPPVWEEVRHEFLQSVAEFRQPDGSYLVPGEFVTVIGHRH